MHQKTSLNRSLIITLFSICLSQVQAQQGVGINTDGSQPHGSAMLDVKSTTKGFLPPRVTDAQRLAIVSPAAGLLVYETTSNAFWMYNGSAWAQLGSGGGGSSQWTTNGNHIYSANSGNVGIGLANAEEKLHLLGNMRINYLNPTLQFQQAAVDKGYLQLAGNNFRLGTNVGNSLGNFIIRMNGYDRVFVDSTGKVGIGTSVPSSLLEVAGGVFLNSAGPKLKFQRGNTILDFSTIDFLNSAGDVKFRMLEGGTSFTLGRPNSFGINDDVAINNATGNVGFGTAPHATDKLYSDGSIRMTGPAKVIRFETQQGGTSSGNIISTKWAPGIHFIRAAGDILGKMEYVDTVDAANFLRFHTGSATSNDLTIGTDHQVGIGTSEPQAKLQIFGGAGEQLRVHAVSDPIIQFTEGLLSVQDKKGYIQISGDDLRLGTNAGNATGRFIVRNNGGDRFSIDPVGRVAVNMNASGEALRLNGVDPAINIYQSGVQKSYLWQTGNDLRIGVSDGAGKIIVTSNQVEIGTSIALPAGYKLGIGGKVICEELKVKLQSSTWPDYVFEKAYRLKPLQEVEQYILTNKHLPNIPSAKEIEANGMEVGEMQRKMMEKIEELTLYIIDLEKKATDLQKRINLLENK